VVYQGVSAAAATFTGTVLSFDPGSNVLRLINTTGTQTLNAPIFGASSLTARTVLSVSTPDFITFSGFMTYIENRESVQRSADGIEQFKFVLGY
jgi:16S rRNA C1402 (ribose-2'-O) methylase RsmI